MHRIRRPLLALLVGSSLAGGVVLEGPGVLGATTTTVATTTTTVKSTTSTTSATTTTVRATTTTTIPPTTTTTAKSALPPRTLIGLATYYRPPTKGVYFGPTLVCATIKAIPMKTKVTITNLGNGKVATCMVGDRKAESTVRIIDLNNTVFASLAPLTQGVLRVKLTW
jgi:rare lipoprotein A (peptidoglycan hydrolase)